MKPFETNSNIASNLHSKMGLQDGNIDAQSSWHQDVSAQTPTSQNLITIFAVPKPFGNEETDLIQRNAIRSWLSLPNVDVILIGDEAGIEETANELGAKHFGDVEFNKQGTPLVSSAFEIAHREAQSSVLVYCNSDVILMRDFVRAVELLVEDSTHKSFVAFGRRTDLKVEKEIQFESPDAMQEILSDCNQHGSDATNACKEYFAFTRDLYQDIPKFAIGRGNWDNWMIHSAKQSGFPVINLSEMVTVVHQDHDYSHTGTTRYQCYVSGAEAEENQRLAKGRHLISGSTANWKLTPNGLCRERHYLLSRSFWTDIPRFTRLMMNMLFQKSS